MTRSPAYRTAVRALLAIGVAAVWVVGSAGGSEAHNVLRSTSPADGAVVETVPAEVVLTFDQPALAVGTEVLVRGPGGEVQTGKPVLVDTVARQAVRGGPAGAYTVTWRATSADGHPISGRFGFTTTAARAPDTSPSSDASVAGPEAPVAAPEATTAPTGAFRVWVVVGVVIAGLAAATTAVVMVVVPVLKRRRRER